MTISLNARLAAMSRSELVAGIGVALIVWGLILRFLGSVLVLHAVALLRSMSDEAIMLAVKAFSLLEIGAGIALLVLVAREVRRRASRASESENRAVQP